MQNAIGSFCGRLMRSYQGTAENPDPNKQNHGANNNNNNNNKQRKLTPYEQARIFDLKPLIDPTKTSPQTESLFFRRLPLEIRCHIYSFIIPEHRRLWVQRRLRNGKLPDADDDDAHVEHFPCRQPPRDMTCTAIGGTCCIDTSTGFFMQLERRVVLPHDDSLALMSTCHRTYLELVPMWTYCFDDLDTMNAFTSIAAALPIRHAQVVVYPHYQLYDPNFGWARHTNSEWEKKLEKVSAACERIPGLATLLLSLQPRPQYGIFVDKQAVLDSCRQLTVSCRVQAEILGRPDQDVVTNREDAMMNIRIEIERRQLHLDCELMNVGEVRDNLETHEPRSSRRALNQIPREVRNI